MANQLIAFMAKLTPELLTECEGVFGNAEIPTPLEVGTAAQAIREVRAAEAALAPKKKGRPVGSRTRKRDDAGAAS